MIAVSRIITEGMGKRKMNNDIIEEKYKNLPHPAVIINSDGEVAFVNEAARKNLKFIRKNSNIALLFDSAELEELREVKMTGKAGVVKMKVQPSAQNAGVFDPVSAFAIPERTDGVEYIALLFVPPFDLIGGKDAYEAEIKRILAVYNKEKSFYVNNALFGYETGDLKDICGNYKKISRIDKYINICLKNLLCSEKASEPKQTHDITDSLIALKNGFDKYVLAHGYKIKYVFDNRWFYFECSEWDFLMINATTLSFALRNSADKKIDYNFKVAEGAKAAVEITFLPPEKIYDYFVNSMSMDITAAGRADDVNYFDLYLACMIAKNNNMLLGLSSDERKIKLILEMKNKELQTNKYGTDLKSGNHISNREKKQKIIEEFLRTEFLEIDT